MDNGTVQHQCGGCRHYVRGPRDPNNLAAPCVGECRWGPPHISHVPHPSGQLVKLTAYPNVQDASPACGQYARAHTGISIGAD